MHGARTMKRTVSMLVVCALGLSIDIGAAHADEPPAAGGVFASEDLTASVVDEGWALSRIEGSYKLAAAIPGAIAVVTISSIPPAVDVRTTPRELRGHEFSKSPNR